MIKEDTRTTEHTISFSILFHNPMSIEFCHGIRAIRMKGGCFTLRYFLYFSVKFGGRSLIYLTTSCKSTLPYCLQYTQHPRSIHICRKFRCIKTYLYMALCCQIINFCRTDFLYNLHNAHRITQVGIM